MITAGRGFIVPRTGVVSFALPFIGKRMTARDLFPFLVLLFSTAHADIERCTGDLDGDTHVNFVDLGTMLDQWFTPCVICSADLNGSGTVNFLDLALLKENAFAQCDPAFTLPPDSRCQLAPIEGHSELPVLYTFTMPNGRPWRLNAPPGEIKVTGATDLTWYRVKQCWPIIDGRDHT